MGPSSHWVQSWDLSESIPSSGAQGVVKHIRLIWVQILALLLSNSTISESLCLSVLLQEMEMIPWTVESSCEHCDNVPKMPGTEKKLNT